MIGGGGGFKHSAARGSDACLGVFLTQCRKPIHFKHIIKVKNDLELDFIYNH